MHIHTNIWKDRRMNFIESLRSNTIKTGDFYMQHKRMFNLNRINQRALDIDGENYTRVTYQTRYGQEVEMIVDAVYLQRWKDDKEVKIYREIRKQYIKALEAGKIKDK